MDATAPKIVGLRMLGVVASMWALVRKRMERLQTMLRPTVHRGKDTTYKTMWNASAWPRERWKSCSNGSYFSIVALCFGHHGTKDLPVGGHGSKVWPPSNSAQQLPTTRDNMQHVCKRTQHVTSNNVGRCWPAMLRPFSRGLKNIVTHILPFLLQFFLVIRWYRSFYSSFSLFRFGYLETINIKALNGEFCFL